jgi:signal transduction histidine kinase
MFREADVWSSNDVAKLLRVCQGERSTLERILDTLPTCIAIISRERRITFANAAMERAFPDLTSVLAQVETRLQAVFNERTPRAGFALETTNGALTAGVYPGTGEAALLLASESVFSRAAPNISPESAIPVDLGALERVAGQIAHRLNSLLTVVLSYAEMISDQYRTVEALHRDVAKISEAAGAASRITQDLLTFSGGRPSVAETLDLDRILAGMAAIFSSVSKGVRVSIIPDAPGAHVRINHRELETVVLNVVRNAKESICPNEGSITVRTSRVLPQPGEPYSPVRYVRISVSDTGCGMPEEHRARAVEPFFSTKAGHIGMGLSVAYGIVRRGGGTITIGSVETGGTVVDIILPEHLEIST